MRAVTVTLAGGVYRLASTLTAADSGGGSAGTVCWKAASGQFPVISGGARVTGWTKGSGNVWSAPAPTDPDTRQLYDISGNSLDLGLDIPLPSSSAQHTSGIVVKDSTSTTPRTSTTAGWPSTPATSKNDGSDDPTDIEGN